MVSEVLNQTRRMFRVGSESKEVFCFCEDCKGRIRLPLTMFRAMTRCNICKTDDFCHELHMTQKGKKKLIERIKRHKKNVR